MTTTARAVLDAALTEKQWQATVVEFAQRHAWLCYHTHDSRRSQAGFPDLCLVRSLPDGDRRIIFAELKRHNGRTTKPQREWLHALSRVAEVTGHVEAHLWSPSDWHEVVERLT